ncbi:MAG: hypothetical protein QXK96_05375 [Candidatus Bathyarchaeia archaeon]
MSKRLVVGALLFILGFVTYQVGDSLIPKENRMMIELFSGLLPKDIPTETFGLLLQFGGGIAAILGLIVCLNSLGRPVVRIQPVAASPLEASAAPEKQRCKFCGGSLEVDSVFCPVCGRSQK